MKGQHVMTPEQIRKDFRARGETFSQWARKHGYKPQAVSRLLNGYERGNYGTAHEIAVKLGLKPQPDTAND